MPSNSDDADFFLSSIAIFAFRLFVFCLKWGYNPPLFSAVVLLISIWDLLYIKTVLIASAVYFGALFPPTKIAMALQWPKLFQVKQGLAFHCPIAQPPI
jgi:hypothetical protein